MYIQYHSIEDYAQREGAREIVDLLKSAKNSADLLQRLLRKFNDAVVRNRDEVCKEIFPAIMLSITECEIGDMLDPNTDGRLSLINSPPKNRDHTAFEEAKERAWKRCAASATQLFWSSRNKYYKYYLQEDLWSLREAVPSRDRWYSLSSNMERKPFLPKTRDVMIKFIADRSVESKDEKESIDLLEFVICWAPTDLLVEVIGRMPLERVLRHLANRNVPSKAMGIFAAAKAQKSSEMLTAFEAQVLLSLNGVDDDGAYDMIASFAEKVGKHARAKKSLEILLEARYDWHTAATVKDETLENGDGEFCVFHICLVKTYEESPTVKKRAEENKKEFGEILRTLGEWHREFPYTTLTVVYRTKIGGNSSEVYDSGVAHPSLLPTPTAQ